MAAEEIELNSKEWYIEYLAAAENNGAIEWAMEQYAKQEKIKLLEKIIPAKMDCDGCDNKAVKVAIKELKTLNNG